MEHKYKVYLFSGTKYVGSDENGMYFMSYIISKDTFRQFEILNSRGKYDCMELFFSYRIGCWAVKNPRLYRFLFGFIKPIHFRFLF
jgi:hypothetical protein